MKREIFETIRRKYSKYSSFAIWDDNDLKNVSIIKKNIDILNPNIIIVGFNASGVIKKEFGNFHCKHRGGRDGWLREVFNHGPIRGAYMTDIVKNDFSSRMDKANLSKNNIKLNVRRFKKEMNDLKSKNPIIISMGDAPANILKDLNNYKMYKIPHYAKRGIQREDFIQAVKKLAGLIDPLS